MEARRANTWRMTVNEKKFIEAAAQSDLRVDGRRPYDYRRLVIEFGREDGSCEVQLGQTRVMGFVTAELTQPYRDRPNEGTLAIYTEYSPMADPSFEVGRPGESAVELGRIIDRGLRESRAIDTESLCVLAGKLVWSIRIDLQILDNGGNLVDAANIAVLAALLTFRRPECTLGGEDGQEVIIHPPEVQEPLPLIVHHLPIAVTFAFFSEGIVMIDPSNLEEAVMGGRMTATLNTNGDICAIQKPGGLGILSSDVTRCLRIASSKAADITSKIKSAVDSYNTKRTLSKIKRHPTLMKEKDQTVDQTAAVSKVDMDKLATKESCASESNDMEVESYLPGRGGTTGRDRKAECSMRGPSSWDPYSKGVDSDSLKASLASRDSNSTVKDANKIRVEADSDYHPSKACVEDPLSPSTEVGMDADKIKSLTDAVKPKNKKKRKNKKGLTPVR